MRNIKFAKDNFYHLYNRGVEKRNIFLDDNDRWRFLQGLFLFNDIKSSTNILWQVERLFGRATFKTIKTFLKKQKREPLVRLMADCLMPNHYHLLVEEINDGGISRFMHKLGTGYTMYFNKKHRRVGSLFQGPYKVVAVADLGQLERLLAYINVINPGQLVEPRLKEKGIKSPKKIMSFAKDYLWGTHQEYLGKRESIIIDKGILGDVFSDPNDYRKFIATTLEEKKFEDIDDIILE